ncbi:MAG: DUF1127 domain-containing protein [Pseudorhodobacter sp.]|jgi:uncharacterized protein YjiS (DUF1127 family)|nr:DUF1127 domain-containing protein [Pseudorhodobacter sp.]
MSAYDTNRVLHHRGFSGVVARLFGAIAVWNDARQTRNELAKLTDRELDDIGLSRGDIDRVAMRF